MAEQPFLADLTERLGGVLRTPEPSTEKNVKTLGIGVARSAAEALDILEQAQAAEDNPTLLKRLARTIGWK